MTKPFEPAGWLARVEALCGDPATPGAIASVSMVPCGSVCAEPPSRAEAKWFHFRPASTGCWSISSPILALPLSRDDLFARCLGIQHRGFQPHSRHSRRQDNGCCRTSDKTLPRNSPCAMSDPLAACRARADPGVVPRRYAPIDCASARRSSRRVAEVWL